MADSFNTYFSTVCAPSETDDSNVPTHSVYLSNPPKTTFGFEKIDNRTVLEYINNWKPSHCCRHENISSNTCVIQNNRMCYALATNALL